MTIFQRWKQTALHNKALVISGAIVALGTAVSTLAVISQIYIAVQNNKSTSQQLDRLIQAANIQAGAANSFAASTSNINSGISGAVDKLNLQVAALGRVSKDIEVANKNVTEADRPWMGAVASVGNFEVGKKPTFTVIFINSGRRAARVDFTATRARWYPKFPVNPDSEYIYDTTPSTSIVVPGQQLLSPSQLPSPLSQAEMDAMVSGALTYFFFGKIEYRDTRTNDAYWTHVCIRYLPAMKNDADNGWRNCAEYNEVGAKPSK